MIGCLCPRGRSQNALRENGLASIDRSHNALSAGGPNIRGRSMNALGADGLALFSNGHGMHWVQAHLMLYQLVA
jgi:hypothetical protein